MNKLGRIFFMNQFDVTGHDWAKLLHDSLESHKYIVHDGKSYQVLQAGSPKLSLKEIKEISKNKIEELSNLKLSNASEILKTKDLVGNIQKNTLRLIESREEKYNKTYKQVLRTIALVLSAVASVVLIGIPFFILLRRQDQQFRKEMEELKQGILYQPSMHNLGISKENRKVLAELPMSSYAWRVWDAYKSEMHSDNPQFIGMLKGLLDAYLHDMHRNQTELKLRPHDACALSDLKLQLVHLKLRDYNDPKTASEMQNELNASMQEDWEYHERMHPSTIPEPFQNDIQRGVQFMRTDPHLQVNDQTLLPDQTSQKQVEDASKAILALGEGKAENRPWMIALYLAATQKSFMPPFREPKFFFSHARTGIDWNKENGKDFQLIPEFSHPDRLPPIRLMVIRNEKHEIVRIDVRVKDEINLVKKQLRYSNSPANAVFEDTVIVPNAVTADMFYSIKLGDKKQPIIENVKCHYGTSIDYMGTPLAS